MVNALLTPEHRPKKVIMTYHLSLKFSSIFKNNFPLKIAITSVESCLKVLKK